jgi:hypothetical protein
VSRTYDLRRFVVTVDIEVQDDDHDGAIATVTGALTDAGFSDVVDDKDGFAIVSVREGQL